MESQSDDLLQAVIGSLWQNSSGQLSLLRQAVAAPPELFTFEHAENKAPPLEGLQGGQSSVGTPNQAWLCLDLYKTLCKLAEVGHHLPVQQLLELPMKTCPEVGHCSSMRPYLLKTFVIRG